MKGYPLAKDLRRPAPTVATGPTEGPRPVVEVLLGVAAKVVEGPLVGVQEGGELLVPTGEVERPATEPEGENEAVAAMPSSA